MITAGELLDRVCGTLDAESAEAARKAIYNDNDSSSWWARHDALVAVRLRIVREVVLLGLLEDDKRDE